MKKILKVFRKLGVLVVGVPLLVLGVILIPLPGPGILTVLAALFILSLEFDSLKPHRDRAKAEIEKVINKARTR